VRRPGNDGGGFSLGDAAGAAREAEIVCPPLSAAEAEGKARASGAAGLESRLCGGRAGGQLEALLKRIWS